MASTLNSAQASNTSGTANPGPQNPGRSTLRSNSTKGFDGRRQSGSPVDGGQRRTNSHKAWTQGTNPITQRSSYSSSNGNMAHQRHLASPRPNHKESNTSDSHAHDRLVFLFASFIGLQTTITTKSGEKFIGVFSSSSLEPNDLSFLLKMAQRVSQEGQFRTNGVSDAATPFLGSAPDHSMSFEIKDIIDISVLNVTTAEILAKEPNGASQGFRTDSDISGNLAMRERTLQRWEPAETDVDMSLETSNSATGWDQFEANERLFGAKTNYDENIYTTRLDRADPAFKQKQVEAARIAREIEGQDVENSHMREERGLTSPDTGDQDEEDKYSGVRREDKSFPPLLSGQPNKYTPPGRRQAPLPAAAPGAPARHHEPSPTSAVPTPAATPAPIKEILPSDKKSEPVASLKPPSDMGQQSASGKGVSPAISTASTVNTTKRLAPENATANVEAKVLGHFRQFAKDEKAKLQERRRNQASYDRTSKLNELMKFSKSFKLSTPVPKDLVPILAKDRIKQEAIISRALQHVDDKGLPKVTTPPTEPKAHSHDIGDVPPSASSDRQYNRTRQGYPPTGPAGSGGRFSQQPKQVPGPAVGTGMLSHRLADNLQQRKDPATNPAINPVPNPLPIRDARAPPTGPASGQQGITSPAKSQAATASKFNVKAMEFKPNPAASTFTPGGPPATAASARSFSRNRSGSRATTPTSFFGPRKPQPIVERPSINDQFNPIKRMKKENTDQAEKPFAFNGDITPPFRTPPTWNIADENEQKTYTEVFKQLIAQQSVSPQARPTSNASNITHQGSMPFHFQSGMPVSGPPNGHHNLPPQGPHGPSHVDDHHRMQLSASNSQVFPSPRMPHGYPSPMSPQTQPSFGQQPMPPFYVGGAQPTSMRPHFMNSQSGMGAMGAPMMAQQHSNGSYMAVPQGVTQYNAQMPMYSPSPGHVYPHVPAHQSHSGFPSPSRGAPMMMHQNSQSGQPPMFMPGQPYPQHMPPNRGPFSSPHQAHHFPPYPHRTPSNGFNQIPQMPPQMSANTPNSGGSHPIEVTDEGK